MYNEEVKNRFLDEYDNEGTQNTIRAIFNKTANDENSLGKDIYNYSIEELVELFQELNPKVTSTAQSYGRFLRLYISWSISNGYRDNNENPLNLPKEFFNQFIDKTKKIHFSHDDLFAPDGIVESLENAQDQCFISLIFEGMLGSKFSELQNLHYNHINWNTNEIKVHDENGKYHRTITVSNQTMRYIERAYKQTIYKTIKDDGEFSEKPILKTDFIFQAVKSPRVKSGEPVSQSTFYNRVTNIKSEIGIGVDFMTPNGIRQSGMLFYGYLLVKDKIEKGGDAKLTYDEIKVIGEKYNYAMFLNGSSMYYNSSLMKEFLSSENLKTLYNIDVTV